MTLPYTVSVEISALEVQRQGDRLPPGRYRASQALAAAMKPHMTWIRENIRGRWDRPLSVDALGGGYWTVSFKFEFQEDATLFKLFHG